MLVTAFALSANKIVLLIQFDLENPEFHNP